MKEKWKDEQTSCSEEKGELKWPKQKNYIEMWRQGVTVTNGGHRQNGEDVSASLHLRCSPLLRLLRTWGFAHNDATNQKEAADEKFQSSTQSTLTQLSWNVTHIQSRLFSSVSKLFQAPLPPLAGTFEAVEDVSLCTRIPPHCTHRVGESWTRKLVTSHVHKSIHRAPELIRGRDFLKCLAMSFNHCFQLSLSVVIKMR